MAKPKQEPKRKKINYPRAGKGKIRRWLPSWKFLLGSFFSFVTLGALTFLVLYIVIDIPEPDDFAVSQNTVIYYADGSEELGRISEVNRNIVPLSEIPIAMQHAIVASEDKSFYTNSGISPTAIMRALINNLWGGPRQGGSTLTQQYAERYYMGTTTDYLGKIREAILAIKIDNAQSKDEILANYLNTIYFGRGAYGVDAAANAYFKKSASELSLSESALLTAVVPAPSAWDPAKNPEIALQRYQRVLRRMVEDEWITQADADAVSASLPETIAPEIKNNFAGPNGHLLQSVRDELVDAAGLSEDEINRGGYTVITTFDKEMQDAANATMAEIPTDRPAGMNFGLYSMNPADGAVYAMYGGPDYLQRQRNSATQDRAQGGSTFKLFASLEALNQGIGFNQYFNSSSSYTIGNHTFSNYNLRSYGQQNIPGLLKYSVNTGFIRMNEQLGPANTKTMAVKLGLSPDTPGLDENVGNVLGSASVTPQEMARAYATVANGGFLVTPHVIEEIKDANGNVIYAADHPRPRVIQQEDADAMALALQEPFKSGGTASFISRNLDRTYAGKSGTSTGPVSAWFIGFTPQVITAVDIFQIGANGGEEILGQVNGYKIPESQLFPTIIWREYMLQVMEKFEKVNFGKWPTKSGYVRGPVSNVPQAPATPQPATPETPEPAEPETPETPATPEPTPAPSPTPSPTPTPQPTPTPTPTPTPNPTPTPTPTPTPNPTPTPETPTPDPTQPDPAPTP